MTRAYTHVMVLHGGSMTCATLPSHRILGVDALHWTVHTAYSRTRRGRRRRRRDGCAPRSYSNLDNQQDACRRLAPHGRPPPKVKHDRRREDRLRRYPFPWSVGLHTDLNSAFESGKEVRHCGPTAVPIETKM